jgi:hypothetical protein
MVGSKPKKARTNKSIGIRSAKPVRKGWAAAFKRMHKNKDDDLLITDGLETKWAVQEWTW